MDGRSPTSPTAGESTFEGLDNTIAEEVRTLLGTRASGVKARKRLLYGFMAYQVASEVRSLPLDLSRAWPWLA